MTKRSKTKPGKQAHRKTNQPKHQKTTMLHFSQASGISGCIALAVGGYLISFGNHKIPSIWILFTGVVLSALCGALYLHAEALMIPEAPTAKAPKEPTMNQPIHHNTITTSGQRGGFAGINTGTVNLAPQLRSISPEQRAELLAMLSNAPKGKIVTTVTENDLEAVAFQKQLVEVFNSAGFAAKAESVMMMSGPSGAPVGLILQIHSELSVPPHAQAIGDALSKVGLNPKTAVSPTTEDGMLFIVVGARPL